MQTDRKLAWNTPTLDVLEVARTLSSTHRQQTEGFNQGNDHGNPPVSTSSESSDQPWLS